MDDDSNKYVEYVPSDVTVDSTRSKILSVVF